MLIPDRILDFENNKDIPAFHVRGRWAGLEFNRLNGSVDVDSSQKVTSRDQWHIGSCGKSFTARLTHLLVQQGQLKAEEKIFKDLTLNDLLTHSSGLPNEYPDEIWRNLFSLNENPTVLRKLVRDYWCQHTLKEKGQFCYSNWNYVLVGQYIEEKLGTAFEKLIETYVMEPLKIKDYGWGAPVTNNSTSPNLGHMSVNGKIQSVPPGPSADNPLFLSPAGCINLSINSWEVFILSLMSKIQGSNYDQCELSDSAAYTSFGLIKTSRNQKSIYFHNGSNTLWYSMMCMIPETGDYFLIAVNSGAKNAQKKVDQLHQELVAMI